MDEKYDIFISYKRKSLATANNLYYRLTTRGYSTFFDLEEMGRGNFNEKLLNYIEQAQDIIVILEEGSLAACNQDDWESDWFCHEIAYALEKGKNIIPMLLNGYKMPAAENLPDKLKGLSYKNAPEFSYTYFDEYLDRLKGRNYINSEAKTHIKVTSVFKFYSNENCKIYKDGKLVGSIEGNSDAPFYLPVELKGDSLFKAIRAINERDSKVIIEHIDSNEEKVVVITWEKIVSDQGVPEPYVKPTTTSARDDRLQSIDKEAEITVPNDNKAGQVCKDSSVNQKANVKEITGEPFVVELHDLRFNMIRVEGGSLEIGATKEQIGDADWDEYPVHMINLSTYYIGQFPITQNIWELVMGYNKSYFKDRENSVKSGPKLRKVLLGAMAGGLIGGIIGADIGQASLFRPYRGGLIGGIIGAAIGIGLAYNWWKSTDIGHYPAENLTHDEAMEFIRRLSLLTNIHFALPTEEEWEYAARGGRKSSGFKYAGSNEIDKVAWFRVNSERHTHPVGQKSPNELGIYDMCGNVWEWTETPAHSYSIDIKPEGNCYIRRGGSWWHESKNCRVSHRYASDHAKKTSGLGLRVVIRENII